MAMRKYFRKLTYVGYSWLLVLRIYLVVGWRFCCWRTQLLLQQLHILESTHTDMKQTLLFIRHGQTTWNAEHLLPGHLPGVALNDIGRQQAARLADALSVLPISAIISSPLERARDTAEILAQGRGLTVQLEDRLKDTDIGRWAGQKYDDLSKNDPEWKAYVHNPTVAPEGVETFPQVQQRALAAIEHWRIQEDIGDYPAFVAHADVIKLLIAYYTGLDAGRAGTLFIDNASVSLVEIDKENIHPVRVVAVSWNPHPGWLKPPTKEEAKKEEGLIHDKDEQEQKT
jgi:probable phosphoglycerate mutase